MKLLNRLKIIVIVALGFIQALNAQVFERTELPTVLDIPWEIQYGKDNYLWISESGGRIVRVNPVNGASKIVFTAPDYFNGSPKESSTLCFKPKIGAGTLGMALHPDFPDTGIVYLVYSYNHKTADSPQTRFKIAQLRLGKNRDTLFFDKTLVSNMPNGFDHLGGRLICAKQNGKYYLFYSTGDNGISETSEPQCYMPQSSNPNNFTQDVNYKNGKIHRFNLDGSIPTNNPISGNSCYTRGHRNPQGLAFNPNTGNIYCSEHGDRTDDEINILKSGKNYGWKQVRGFVGDNNFNGEQVFAANYRPDPQIAGDSLMEPLFSWCHVPQPLSNTYTDWCTVAPSDMLYYNHKGIAYWNNSLLVVTLKKSETLKQGVYRFALEENGERLVSSTSEKSNPELLFESDYLKNGRLRDLVFDGSGEKLFLINNGGADRDKIICYKMVKDKLELWPNPSASIVNLNTEKKISSISLYDINGRVILSFIGDHRMIDLSALSTGIYIVEVVSNDLKQLTARFVKL